MTTLSLQPDGTTGIDTQIRDTASVSNNYGTSTTMGAGINTGAGNQDKGLIKFDLSSIPAGVNVLSAILTLTSIIEDSSTDFNVAAHRSLVEWFEGEKAAAPPDGGQDGSTWNHRNANGSVAWAGGAGGASGSDYAVSPTDTTLITETAPDTAFDWDVTVDVQDFIDGTYSNYGWWLLGEAGTDTRKVFHQSGSSTPASRPQLVVEYIDERISGTFSGIAAFSGAMPVQEMSGSFAGAATLSGAVVGWGFLSGSFAGIAGAFTGAMAAQEMSGSFAGGSSFIGGGRAILLPKAPIWKAIIAGVEYALSGGNPFHRLETTGLGISNIRNIKQRGPFQDGSTRRDFRLDERFLNLLFLLKGANRAQVDTYRDTLIEIFKPLTSTPCQIRVTRDDGIIKQIDTYAVGVLDIPETDSDRGAAWQRVAVQLEAPNPIWYGPELQNLGFSSVQGGTAGFGMPVMLPWAQQAGEFINVTESFYYEGNWKEFPVIVITGPASDAKITNLTTNEKIDFTGYTIAASDSRTIDLRFGTKTVKNAIGVLKNNELTSDSNLGTFHLAANPEAPGGINEIKVEILSGATTETRVSLQYYHRFTHL